MEGLVRLRLLFLPLLFACGCATPKASGPGAEEWAPPPPAADEWDWIRLKSGEWLKGEIKSMREKSLEFESDELDELTLDWSDVAELRSPRRITVTFEGRTSLTGPVEIDRREVRVGGTTPRTEARARLVSIAPEGETEWKRWSGDIGFGLTARAGNTDQVETTANIRLQRQTAFSRVIVDYLANYGRLAGEENVNNHRAHARWDLFLSRKWYATPASIEYFRDPFANIEGRLTPGASLGYHVVDTDDLTWDVGLGAGWRFTRYGSVAPGEDDRESTGAILLSTGAEYDLTKDIELSLDWQAQVGVERIEDTNHHLVAKISVDLPRNLELDVSFTWDRIGNPRTDSDGRTPERDDFRITVGLGWDF